jgi:hypothetical protein
MPCKRCASDSQQLFNGEIAIHFPGLKGLDKPIVWMFPKVAVCLECGFTDFKVPEKELRVLVHGIPVEGAMISGENVARASEKGRTKPFSPGMNG